MRPGAEMSALFYGALTRTRTDQTSGASATSGTPGTGTYLDAVAALVPAEVLAVHAVILALVTTTSDDGNAVITDVPTLRVVFWVLVVLSAALYIVGRKSLKGLDFVRVLIPPAAFVAWTMLQRITAFDAIAPHMAATVRSVTAVLAALVLGVVAAQLGMIADKASPPGEGPAQDPLRQAARSGVVPPDPDGSENVATPQASTVVITPASHIAPDTALLDQSQERRLAGDGSVPQDAGTGS
jgi:hypothetical protein